MKTKQDLHIHMIYYCKDCGGKDILQQANLMLPMNDFDGPIKTRKELLEDIMWDDYYYCNDCKDECKTYLDHKKEIT